MPAGPQTIRLPIVLPMFVRMPSGEMREVGTFETEIEVPVQFYYVAPEES